MQVVMSGDVVERMVFGVVRMSGRVLTSLLERSKGLKFFLILDHGDWGGSSLDGLIERVLCQIRLGWDGKILKNVCWFYHFPNRVSV